MPEHGTDSTYKNHHCRCQPCRDAHTAARRAQRAAGPRGLLADLRARTRRRGDQIGRLTPGGPIHLALLDAQRAELALAHVLTLALGETRVGVDVAAGEVRAILAGGAGAGPADETEIVA